MNLLVADDENLELKVLEKTIKKFFLNELDIFMASNGKQAAGIVENTDINIALLDIEMPRMDGFEVATQIRNSDRLKNLPIVMITSRTGEKHRERAFDIGVNDYMGKPFQEADLLARIHHILDLQDDAD